MIISWFTSQEWFRKLVVILGLALAVLMSLAGMQRKAREAGKLAERERHREEVKKTEKRIEAVKRHTVDELDARLRDGTF